MIKGEIGTKVVNPMMQTLLKHSSDQTLEVQSEELSLRIGERVIQAENDCSCEVMNRKLGEIAPYNIETLVLGVQSEDHWAEY